MDLAGQDAELPEIRSHARFCAAFALLCFAGLGVRLFFLQIIEGDSYYKRTSDSVVRHVVLPALRGEIRDHKGRILATTRPSYNLWVTLAQLRPNVYSHLLATLGPAAEGLPGWDVLDNDDHDRSSRANARLLVEDIPRELMATIETSIDNPGITIHALPRRTYPNETLLAHALGYLNEVSPDELRTRPGQGYRPGDLIGRTGLERQWESYLRGKNGFEKLVVDRRGVRRSDVRIEDLVEGAIRQASVPGNNLILTVDLDIQRITERALRGKIAAAAVVIDIETGRVLALVSKPAFDPNMMSGRLSSDAATRFAADRLRPFIDKTLGETYNPGSTFKAVTALTALEEGLISPLDRTKCTGFIQIGRRRFRCTKSHGQVGLTGAIIQSCNVFFYDLGSRPGMMNRIAKFATDFGLGAPSGLGLDGDQPGFIPTEDWHQAQSTGFVIGHALNTAIGEGATRVTPMQMALLYAAIARGGKLWLPQIVERVESTSGQVLEEFPPRARRDVAVSSQSLAILRKALIGVVNDPKGTAYKTRARHVLVAGKTGTAFVQKAARRKDEDPPLPYEQIDHAWFAGFSPAEDPRIAMAIIVEHGGHGGDVAAPVAVEISQSVHDLMTSSDHVAKTGVRR